MRIAIALLVLLCGLLLGGTELIAQAPPGGGGKPPGAADASASDPTKVFNEAMIAFQSNDFATAATKLEKVIATAGQGAQLESVYFTLGAAYFNLQQYPKAIETLKQYQTKYPQGARIADATFSIAQASFASKDYGEAAAQFARLENTPQYREQALFYGALALKEDGKLDDAAKRLEALTNGELKSSSAVNGAMILAGIYAQKKEVEKANALIRKMMQNLDQVENIASLNATAVDLGDKLLQDHRPADALTIYRVVRSRDDIVAFQARRVAALKKQLEDNLTAMRADPQNAVRYLAPNNQLKADIAEAERLYEESKMLPDFTPALLMRMGQAYYEMEKRWEAIVAYGDILERFPTADEREAAMFAMIVSYAELSRVDSARKLGEQYLKEYPARANASTVGYLMGAMSLQANDPADAEKYFGRMLGEQPNSTFKEEMRFMLANAKFTQGKYEEASKDYEQYQKDFPQGSHVEEATYRIALGLVFAGKYEKALAELDKYLQSYPKGAFIADAKYRIAVCLFAAQQYDDVAERCRNWEKEFPHGELLGEVLALLGDCLMAKDKVDLAVETYIRSYKVATSDQVLNYSLFEAQKGLQKKGDWAKMSAMFEEFVKQHPDHPSAVMAVYWIAKARAHEGKVDEAKQFIAETIKKYIDDPKREAVEQLLSQLAQLCVRKKPLSEPAVSPNTALPASSLVMAAASAAPTPEVDPGAELDALLGGPKQTPTGKARVLYAKSELARMRRKPDEQNKQLKAIADNFKPEELSPMLIAQVGDILLAKGELDKAEKFFRYLMDEYPKSEVVDFAYNGLGEIAYQKKDYPTALKYFSDAIDKVGANQKLKDVTLGRAKTLLAMGKLDEAQKQFEQVASVREWRGDATACAVYSLGQIQFQRGKYAEANAEFQRVFVAYQKFLPWVAKAYISSGECFEKLGKTQEAIKTYQEMLRNDKLAKFEEIHTAEQRLQALGGAKG